MKARPYQTACLQALLHFFATHPNPDDNPCCAMPTGSGKALCIADFMQYVMKTWPGQRIINLVHVKELVQQNALTLKRLWPQAPVGVFSAGLGERTAHMPITFAGTKSVASNLKLFGRQDIVIVDEAHLIPEKEESEYRKVLAYFKALNPQVRVIGFSATPFRMGLGLITEGSIFTHIAYDITGLQAFNDLLDEGYLCPLIPIQTQMIIDVSGVKKIAGEFSAGELERTVNREHLTRAALMETVRAARERDHWLIFASGIEHVDAVAKMLREEFDITCATVHGKMPAAQRDEAILDFKSGKVRALVNANILLTGFDFPALDCLVCLRPTNSVVLHIQALGRGTRPFYAPGFDLETTEGRLGAIAASSKQNCLVLDFSGNVMRNGPINDPRIPKRKGAGDGTIPVKLCDECGCLNHISNRTCDNCGADFKIEEKITETASTAELIAKVEGPISERFEVKHVTYEEYRSKAPGKPVMLQAHYYCGVQRFSEVVCIEHYGQNVRNLAKHWWKERTGDEELPGTVSEALQQAGRLRAPKAIQVWINRKAPGTRKLQPQITKAYF